MKKEYKKVVLISLGCAKNLVDSEYMLGLLAREGYAPISSIDEADISVINTCGFIESSVQESIETILDILKKKSDTGTEKVLVTGCLVQRYGKKLKKEIPEVDGWFGVGCAHDIIEYLKNGDKGANHLRIRNPCDPFLNYGYARRIQSTPSWSAYLKIADGCSNRCSYCTIPAIRGSFRSRPFDLILSDVKEMAQRGVKEVNIVAQDTTMYGLDLEGDYSIEKLLEAIAGIEGIRWIRLLYCHPWRVTDRLLNIIDDYENICPYIDIPLQHVNRDILKKMNRYSEYMNPYKLIEKIRARKRNIAIRTTMMVGFPGESEKEFKELMDFVKWAEFDNLGAFIFSPEQGTRAGRLKGKVDNDTAIRRLDELMALQQEISLKKNKEKVGKTLNVLIEGASNDPDYPFKGRSSGMAPEVDGSVYVRGENIQSGEFVPVLIKESAEYDLKGEMKIEREDS